MTLHTKTGRRTLLAGAAVLPLAASAGSAPAETTLRVVPQAELKVLDPFWTTSQLTQAHGLMVYDQLFALDSKLVPQPQMVDRWSTSADGLTWDFTLRPGLRFSDGSEVTARDAVASLKRWAARTSDGQLLMQHAAAVDATAPDAFSMAIW